MSSEFWTDDRRSLGSKLWVAIGRGEVPTIEELCAAHPWLIRDYTSNGEMTWVGEAASDGNVAVMAALLDLGFDVNALRLPEKSSALTTAIDFSNWDMVVFLLESGANPNLDRPLIAALNVDEEPERLETLRLLIEHGADVNRIYDLYGDPEDLFTALDWAKGDEASAAYLRSHGAKTLDELRADAPSPPQFGKQRHAKSTEDEVVDFFKKTFGPVTPRSQVEIVATGWPIAIHAIEPSEQRPTWVLFTTGLSSKAMERPEGQEDYSFGELFLELPDFWKPWESQAARWDWPAYWLRKVGQYPHDHSVGLGGPVSFLANGEPPEPLAVGCPFTTWMLFAEKSFMRTDQKEVHLYRMVPIYTEERDFEKRAGLPALMRIFDRQGLPFKIDPNRRCFVDQQLGR